VPEVDRSRRPLSLDVPGALLAVVGLGAVIYAMTAGPASGWGSVPVLTSAVVGVVCLVALVPVERRQRQPIIALALFRIRQFTAINAAPSCSTAPSPPRATWSSSSASCSSATAPPRPGRR